MNALKALWQKIRNFFCTVVQGIKALIKRQPLTEEQKEAVCIAAGVITAAVVLVAEMTPAMWAILGLAVAYVLAVTLLVLGGYILGYCVALFCLR